MIKLLQKYGQEGFDIYYKDILDNIGLKEFDKIQLIQFLEKQVSSPKIYLAYGALMTIYTFLAYFISTLMEVLILSFFGWLTTLIAKLQMRYRAIFNMSVYAFTISTILQAIYIYIGLYTDFNIKYFDLMYTTIAFICLAAAIFMIKSDLIKQQIELMKVIEIQRQNENEKQKEQEETDKEDEETEKDNESKGESKKEKKKEGKVDDNIEGQGSNA